MQQCVWFFLRRKPESTSMFNRLPTELLLEIMNHLVTSVSDLAAVARTNRRLHGLVNPLVHTAALATPGRYRCSVMRWAVARGDVMLLQRLLLYGKCTGVDERHWITGTTALHGALMLERREAVIILLCNGAGIDIPDRRGWTALHWAVLSGNCNMAEEIVNYGGSPERGTENHGRTGTTPLHMAAARGDYEMARLLIRHGAKVEPKDENGRRAVDFALALLKGEDGGRNRDLVEMLAVSGRRPTPVMDCSGLLLETRVMLLRWKSVVWDEKWLARLKYRTGIDHRQRTVSSAVCSIFLNSLPL